MNTRMRLFKWRAIARRLAKSAPPGSAEQTVAAAFRDGLDAALVTNFGESRWIAPHNIGRGAFFNVWFTLSSKQVYPPPISLVQMLDPERVTEPEWRISALINLFNQMASGAMVMTPTIQSAFHRAAQHDPDAKVRAWALHLLDPEQYPPPEDKEG